jgi:hypothetical protein
MTLPVHICAGMGQSTSQAWSWVCSAIKGQDIHSSFVATRQARVVDNDSATPEKCLWVLR